MRIRLSSGLSMAYVTQGAGRTIVLLHPVGLRSAFWRPVMDELKSEFRLIAPDFRGHGDSDAPMTPFGLDDLANDVADLVQAVGHGPTFICGCSMGGMVAQAISVRRPDLVAGIVIANTAHRRTDESRAAMEQRAVAAEGGMTNALRATLSRWFDAEVQISRPELVVQARDWLLDNDPVVHAWSWRAIKGLAYADQLKSMVSPSMVVAGIRDQSTPIAAMKDLAETLPNSTYMELDTGHLAPFENPASFAQLLRDFMAAHPAPDTSFNRD